MYLNYMRPAQVHEAIRQNIPLLLPAGCVECHGTHAALGLDTLVAEELCTAIAKQLPAVVAPGIEYGPTGWAVSGPELGTVDIDGDVFYHYVKEVLRSMILMGWERIIVIIHHQGMDGPEALAFRKAAADLSFELTCAEKGLGWWGYQPPETHGNVWGHVQVRPTILPAAESVCHGDHAGHLETSLLMYLHPELVDLGQLDQRSFWYTDQPDNLARTSNAEDGQRYFDAMLSAWVAELGLTR
jgi:creatinine amidohydrolase